MTFLLSIIEVNFALYQLETFLPIFNPHIILFILNCLHSAACFDLGLFKKFI